MQIIGFGYRKRVGKDTAAKFLINDLRIRFSNVFIKTVGFSDKLKDICFQLYSWDGLMPGEFYEVEANVYLRDVPLPTIGKSPRQIWIEMGTYVGREVYAGTWTQYAIRANPADLLIFKDLRFANEVDVIHEHGGKVYLVENDRIPYTDDVADRQLKEYTGWDGTLSNQTTLHDFHKIIMSLSATINLGKT